MAPSVWKYEGEHQIYVDILNKNENNLVNLRITVTHAKNRSLSYSFSEKADSSNPKLINFKVLIIF
jgi:hypothetical protein